MSSNIGGTPSDNTKSSEEGMEESISRSKRDLSDTLVEIPGVDERIVEDLFEKGLNDAEAISKSEIDEMVAVNGLTEEKAEEIKEKVEELKAKTGEDGSKLGNPNPIKSDKKNMNEEDELAQWLTGESDRDITGILGEEIEEAKEKGPKPKTAGEKERDFDSLKAWLAGEEESFSDWLGEESFEEEKEELEEELKEKEMRLEQKENELEKKAKELEDLKERFKNRLSEIESEDFDPHEMLEKNNELKSELESKKEKIEKLEDRKEDLEEEIEEIKQGSVAMVKYLKSQQISKDTEGEVSNKKLKLLKNQNDKLKKKIQMLKNKKTEQGGEIEGEKNEIIRDLKSEIKQKEEKIEHLEEKIRHKEQELNEREEDLHHREQLIRKERQKLEAMKKEIGGKSEQERKRQLEELEKEISKKEQEIKAKEKYIEQKEKEIKARQEDLLDEELEERQEEILREIEQEKCKTGTGRLDDLLLGGIPLGSNVSVYGPPHVGKEVLINSFIAEGLEKGVPAIWVVTDKTIDEVREEMKFVLPTYEEYELRGLVYYVDAYSVSMGEVKEEEKDKNFVKYIEDQSDFKSVTEAVDEFADKLNEEHRYYRMAFESVSTIIAYLDTETTFRILQPFAGRRKRDKAVTLYTLEKGMHSEQDISMLGHIMNGEIEFKVEQLKNHLRVEGLGDVQTRDWIEYSFSKSGINMGSFSLDTIR